MGAMENGRGLARIKHAEGAGVIEAVIRLGRAGVFDTEVARQPQGTFIDQGRGTGKQSNAGFLHINNSIL